MNDVVKKYKKQEFFKYIWFGILAFWIGFFTSQFMHYWNINSNFLKNDLNNSLQIASSTVSQKDAKKQEKKDIYLERVDKDNLVLILNKKLDNVKKINFNLAYEENKVNIEEIKSLDKNFEIIEISSKNWLKIISVIPKNWIKTFPKKILNIKIKKLFKSWDDFTFINITSANYTTDLENKEENFNSITSSWINVF